ncbi:ankyrin repeat-containing domain protein [Mycena galopus ATCC 62051]|nr:ankyrin repeat-containing domain protein [Mycena galopus ATCC 62051]
MMAGALCPQTTMAVLLELPPELILHIVSLLTRRKDLHPIQHVIREDSALATVPDLPSINALSRTSVALHQTLNETLYVLCASVEPLGNVALLFAVQHGLENTVDRLVATGISLDTSYDDSQRGLLQIYGYGSKRSLLQIAAGNGLHSMVVKLLGMYGEDMRAKVHIRDDSDKTALDHAARSGHLEVARILAPIPLPDHSVHDGASPASDTFQKYLSIALVEAATAGNIEISEYLVSEGADVNFAEGDFTPLFHAAENMDLELIRFLLSSGADPNLQGTVGDLVPLFSSARHADMDAIQALLAGGANLHVKGIRSGQDILAEIKDVEILCFFLERGADPNYQDMGGFTPLHYACTRKKSTACIELLLQFGAAVEIVSRGGSTPVDMAMHWNNPEAVKILEPLLQDPVLRLRVAKWWERRGGHNAG